ncbi:MAG TPA: hypothetical protein VL463_25075 [Kofleriaceae bacterium]|nr:hypothetical protein [Kofleriaceae bacterium]
MIATVDDFDARFSTGTGAASALLPASGVFGCTLPPHAARQLAATVAAIPIFFCRTRSFFVIAILLLEWGAAIATDVPSLFGAVSVDETVTCPDEERPA